MSDRFTEKAENALNLSVKVAENLGHSYIGTEHLLLALAKDEYSCASLILKKNGIGRDKIYAFIKEYSGIGNKSSLSSKDLTPRARKILEGSYNNANQHGDGTIGTEHILLTLIEEKDCVASKLLKTAKADVSAIRDDVYTLLKSRERALQKHKREGYSNIIKQHGKNLCEMAKEGKFDPVIGRDKEIERVIRVLSRKNKNNPCLIGEAGVGKTAIVEGLAERIAKSDVPPSLIDKTIISLDLTSIVAGAKYRGDFEERIKNIINEVVKHKDIILFIDEIHTIVGAGAAEGAIDASNILKPQLARGDVQIIGATTYEEYRKYIEKDAALERRFQPIEILEPSAEETVDMLMALKDRYEEHHNVEITDAAIRECVTLSSRYVSDRYLPDKAIDILDEACAMMSSKRTFSIKSDKILEQIISNGNIKEISRLDIEDISRGEYPTKCTIDPGEERPSVTPSVIKDIISEMCGIPSSLIRKSIDYEELEANLNSAVKGQKSAVEKLVAAIKRADLGFSNHDRPRGIFLFTGESGVGKTALAIELEKNLFYSEKSLLRFDMSEYSEKQSVSKLIGSPPGYVGHGNGGALTEAVKKRPHSVILFDEIEKADKEILNLLLQIADYGYLSDALGRKINFRNTIIIATSNMSSSSTRGKVGFSSTREGQTKDTDIFKRYYTKELINRFDEIIHFSPLSEDALKTIVKDELEKLAASLKEKGCDFAYTEAVVDFIAAKSTVKGMGARPALREIAAKIEAKIIDMLISRGDNIQSIEAEIIDENVVISDKKALKT